MGTVYSSNDWTDMIENVLKTLCDLDSEAMKNLAFDMHSKYLSSTDKKYGGRWVRITENIFLNVNTDTMTKIRILRDVFEEYDIDTSELRFVLHS